MKILFHLPINVKILFKNLDLRRRTLVYRICSLLYAFLLFSTTFAQVILIDPGHGGEDCGAQTQLKKKISSERYVFETICEKDLALQMAKRLYKKLQPFYSTYLTRSIDRTLTLEERALLAEKVQADIFISIHINASHSEHSHGFETYYLNNHQDEVIKKVEQVENRVFTGDAAIVQQILLDLIIERTAPQSKVLATMIHKEISGEIKKNHKVADRGVKPAIFYVLALSKRPATLLEAGFISNERETRKLLSKKFQENYTDGVLRGIRNYFNKKETPSLF